MNSPLAFIIGSGCISRETLKQLSDSPGRFCICADGGANHARLLNIKPDVIIGDLDSIEPETLSWVKAHSTLVITHPQNKDATDLELSIDYAVSRSCKKIILTCTQGGRVDHAFSNLTILSSPKFRTLDLCIEEDSLFASCVAETSKTFHGNPGDVFSIIPVTETVSGISVSGARWEMSNQEISLGSTRSVSNSFKDETVSVSIDKGAALFIHIRNAEASI